MFTLEEKIIKMSFLGKIEIKYNPHNNKFCLWLPVKLRTDLDLSYRIDLDAVVTDIYGETVEEAINKMFFTLTGSGFIIEVPGQGRFYFDDNSFINVKDAKPVKRATESYKQDKNLDSVNNNSNPPKKLGDYWSKTFTDDKLKNTANSFLNIIENKLKEINPPIHPNSSNHLQPSSHRPQKRKEPYRRSFSDKNSTDTFMEEQFEEYEKQFLIDERDQEDMLAVMDMHTQSIEDDIRYIERVNNEEE